MEIRFTPEQEIQLAQIANEAGTAPEQVVAKLVASYLEGEARFLAAVDRGLAAARRGEFVEEEKKKRWTPASKLCSSTNANSLDRSRG